MKTKTIFKALALAMLMPAILLTTACSSEDDIVNTENTENTIKKGFELPVTINVTRQGDEATTRATFDDGTKKLSFSTGDQLFVSGNEATAGKFAGTLTWQSGGTFSGTLTTQNEFTGTADELLALAYKEYDEGSMDYFVSAILLPAGYNNYDFLTLNTNNGYDATISTDLSKTFALTKAAAVEQFSLERTFSYSNGFTLYPSYGILNFTITGLTPNTDVNVTFSDYTPAIYGNTMGGTVHTDGSGNATFAVAVYAYSSKNIQTCSLYVNGNPIALVNSSKPIEAGKIYNIARNASPLASVTTSDVGKVIGADGNIYANVEAAKAASTTACAIIAYVGSDTGESAPYNHGLAIAMKDANNGTETMWMWNDSEPYCSAVNPHQYTDIADALAAKESGSSLSSGKNTGTYPAFQAALANSIATGTGISAAAPATGTSGWFMPSIFQWNQIVNGLTGTSSAFTTTENDNLNYSAVNPKITAAGGVGLEALKYWSSTEYSSDYAWKYDALYGEAQATPDEKYTYVYVRAAFAF